ncbi:uncharacterized protein RCC_11085 [Ramularia collo-cygni]|uniref:Myb-like domain-containing protein n=1 Tax=Ramularia collo-cygni TaxID=112498 RepID=A0A2D3V7E5_9PEZI|nr:uncharacterized protein RCC_11085 [Ramularia collo-cygni]CZT25356.1 uncharacterized protein RCC_11085 [Ramularia collo-cygni]
MSISSPEPLLNGHTLAELKSVVTADRDGKTWRDEEKAFLKYHRAHGASYSDLIQAMGRSYRSLRKKSWQVKERPAKAPGSKSKKKKKKEEEEEEKVPQDSTSSNGKSHATRKTKSRTRSSKAKQSDQRTSHTGGNGRKGPSVLSPDAEEVEVSSPPATPYPGPPSPPQSDFGLSSHGAPSAPSSHARQQYLHEYRRILDTVPYIDVHDSHANSPAHQPHASNLLLSQATFPSTHVDSRGQSLEQHSPEPNVEPIVPNIDSGGAEGVRMLVLAAQEVELQDAARERYDAVHRDRKRQRLPSPDTETPAVSFSPAPPRRGPPHERGFQSLARHAALQTAAPAAQEMHDAFNHGRKRQRLPSPDTETPAISFSPAPPRRGSPDDRGFQGLAGHAAHQIAAPAASEMHDGLSHVMKRHCVSRPDIERPSASFPPAPPDHRGVFDEQSREFFARDARPQVVAAPARERLRTIDAAAAYGDTDSNTAGASPRPNMTDEMDMDPPRWTAINDPRPTRHDRSESQGHQGDGLNGTEEGPTDDSTH